MHVNQAKVSYKKESALHKKETEERPECKKDVRWHSFPHLEQKLMLRPTGNKYNLKSLTRTSQTANVKMLNNKHKNLQAQANTQEPTVTNKSNHTALQKNIEIEN